jgi:hypothetical protein
MQVNHRQIFKWTGLIVLVLLVLLGWRLYYVLHVLPVPVTAEKGTWIPAVTPGPEDAWLDYQKMLATFPGVPETTPDSTKYLSLRMDLSPADIPGIKQILKKYETSMQWMIEGSKKSKCTLPCESLADGPLSYSRITANQARAEYLVPFQIIARMLVLKGYLAELENRPEDALHCYGVVIRTGIHLSKTTLLIRVTGISIRSMGYHGMTYYMKNSLSRKNPELALTEMKALNPPPEWDDKDLSRYEYGVRWRDIMGVNRFFQYKMDAIIRKSALTIPVQFMIANSRQNICLLAAAVREYQSKHNQLPEKLENLVPEVLPSLPADPLSGESFRYRVKGNLGVIYSIGLDGKDNDAALLYDPTNGIISQGDIAFSMD